MHKIFSPKIINGANQVGSVFSMSRSLLGLTLLSILAGCATPVAGSYQQSQSSTGKFGDTVTDIATPAGLGAAGFFGVKAAGGNTLEQVGGGAAGVGAGLLVNSIVHGSKQQIYQAGITAGANQARADQVNDIWTKQALLGLPSSGTKTDIPLQYVTGYSGTTTINGVIYNGQYQTVAVPK